jgi:hypothetical protein
LQIVNLVFLKEVFSGTQQDKKDLEHSQAAIIEVTWYWITKGLGAQGIIIVYDVTDRDSFDNVR